MADAVKGLPELYRKFKELPKEVQRKGRRAVASAGKPVLQNTRSLAAVDTGLLKQSMGQKTVKRGTGDYACLTGARSISVTKKRKKPGFKVRKGIIRKLYKQGKTASNLTAKWSGLDFVNPTRYLHLVDLGFKHAVGRRKGVVRRILGWLRKRTVGGNRIAGTHFMERGLSQATPAAQQAMAAEFKNIIESEAKK